MDAPAVATASSTERKLALGAVLNARTLSSAEALAEAADGDAAAALGGGAVMPKRAYLLGQVASKAAAVRIPAYRFYNTRTTAHFYTTSETERAHVAGTLSPPYSFDGPAFSVASAASPGLSPVHRFYNTQTGVHFYTISETERSNVATNLPQFTYEGVAYYASQVSGAGLVPLYRFYVPSKGFHFYTASQSERDNIIANLASTYQYEGVGYQVLASDWRAEKLPHTGVGTSQCHEAGSSALVACASAGAGALNPQQDGHRAALNTMSYSAVNGQPSTQCVRDDITGLTWEGKTASGVRSGAFAYTHLVNGMAGDVSRYVQDVNALRPCGYADWRLPTRLELLNLVSLGAAVAPKIATTQFPNTASAMYWTADGDSTDPAKAWVVDFSGSGGASLLDDRSSTHAVRLVRGDAPSGTRFTYSTVAYGGDAANNLVNDAWSGLQWRRCEQGRTWNGTTCTGAATTWAHEQALAHARDQTGWRLPNAKELASLADLSVSGGVRLSAAAFPGALAGNVWASSPAIGLTNFAWQTNFSSGRVDYANRSSLAAVRLLWAGS
ncbi:MAG: DUF1566 domain-containing protein [Burkholderiaceae bacterium]